MTRDRATQGRPALAVPMLCSVLSAWNSLERSVVEESGRDPDGAVWFDLVSPTSAEDKMLERALGIAVPTREEMQEIEVSSRPLHENGRAT
jgi:Mg2+ and Co2+ transporter CorA